MRYKPRRKTSGFRQADLILLHSSSHPTSQLQSEDHIVTTVDREGQPRTRHSFFSVLPDVANISPSLVNTQPSCKHCVSLFHAMASTSSSQGGPYTTHCWGGPSRAVTLCWEHWALVGSGSHGTRVCGCLARVLGKASQGLEVGWEVGISKQRHSSQAW